MDITIVEKSKNVKTSYDTIERIVDNGSSIHIYGKADSFHTVVKKSTDIEIVVETFDINDQANEDIIKAMKNEEGETI